MINEVTLEGIVELEKVTVTCSGCGQTVEAVAHDGVVKGWCAVSRKNVRVVVKVDDER